MQSPKKHPSLKAKKSNVSSFWLPYTLQAALTRSFILMVSVNAVCDLGWKFKEKASEVTKMYRMKGRWGNEKNPHHWGPSWDLQELEWPTQVIPTWAEMVKLFTSAPTPLQSAHEAVALEEGCWGDMWRGWSLKAICPLHTHTHPSTVVSSPPLRWYLERLHSVHHWF